MNLTRAQLDAAEAWLLSEWRGWLEEERATTQDWRGKRDRCATAIRAIRAQRKAIDDAAKLRRVQDVLRTMRGVQADSLVVDAIDCVVGPRSPAGLYPLKW